MPKGKSLKYKKSAKKATKKKSSGVAKSSNLRKRIINVLLNQAETKQAMFYQSLNDGTNPDRASGDWFDRGWAVQNNLIQTNNVDIHQLIPFIESGTEPNQRIGDKITPIGLTVSGSIRIRLSTLLVNYTPADIKVVMYVLQHVSLKDYNSLYANNDFKSLLENGENTSVPFYGTPIEAKLPVNRKSYRLIKKKVMSLRYAGAVSNTGNPATNFSVANCHDYYVDYTMDLTKALPAKLTYPENDVNGVPLPTTVQSTPTNSSIFMCLGFYDKEETLIRPDPDSGPTSKPWIQQTYVSRLTWKDL